MPDGDYKRCGRCRELKPEADFNKLRDGRQHWCRECFRAYFRARGDLHREQSSAARQKRRAGVLPFREAHLRANPCVDCGESDLRVLDFDHIGEKTLDLSRMCNNGMPLDLIKAEIENCEVVCANCHRRRTAARAGWYRLADTAQHNEARWRRRRNVDWVYGRLRGSRCIDCGIDELVLLEFDHIGEKRDSVMNLAWSEYSIATLEAEISECEVRCCNCHRRRTAERRAGRDAAV